MKVAGQGTLRSHLQHRAPEENPEKKTVFLHPGKVNTMGMTTKIDRETGEISEEVSDEEFKEIMRAWKARSVSDEECEEIRTVWPTTTVRGEDCPL